MTMEFFISKKGQQLGPWTYDEVLSKLQDRSLQWTDYVYDDSRSDWMLISDHPSFFFQFQKEMRMNVVNPPPAVEVKAAPPLQIVDPQKWFVLKGQSKYGPFSYLEVVRLMQEKNLYDTDLVWNAALANWTAVRDCEPLQPEKIRELKSNLQGGNSEVFLQRRHTRASFGASVVVHNNKTVWKGQSVEISAGGAGLVLDTTLIQPGQTLFLHFKVSEEVPPFNAICSVVSKQIDPHGKEAKYGVRFTNVSRDVQDSIKTYTDKAA